MILRICLLSVLLTLTPGCSCLSTCESNTNLKATEKRSGLSHNVRSKGETLGKIASWYTGSEKNWKKVLAANPGLEERKLKIGTRIVIPEQLLTRRTAMPTGTASVSRKARLNKSVTVSSGNDAPQGQIDPFSSNSPSASAANKTLAPDDLAIGRVAQPESAKVNTDEVLVETSGDFSDSKILEGLEETTQPASATESSGANGLSSSGDTAEVRDFPLLFENDNPQ